MLFQEIIDKFKEGGGVLPGEDEDLALTKARMDAIDNIEAAVAQAQEEQAAEVAVKEPLPLVPELEARFRQLVNKSIQDLTDDEMDELDDLATLKGLSNPYVGDDMTDDEDEDEGEELSEEDEIEYARLLEMDQTDMSDDDDAEFERLYALKYPEEVEEVEATDAKKPVMIESKPKDDKKGLSDYEEKRYQTLVTKDGNFQEHERSEFLRLYERRTGHPQTKPEADLPDIKTLRDALGDKLSEEDIERALKIKCTCRFRWSKRLETAHDAACALYKFDDWKGSSAEFHPTAGIVWYVTLKKNGKRYLTNFEDYIASEDEAKAIKCRCLIEAKYHCTACGVSRAKETDKWHAISTPGAYSGSSYGGSTYSKCRHAMFGLKFPDGTTVYASSNHTSRDKDEKHPEFALYLDACWRPDTLAYMLPWQDHGLPKIDHDYAMATIIQTFELAKAGKIVEVGCIGGHGRTGCVLACMAVLAGVKGKDAVKFVRDNYCENTVECADQEWFPLWFEAKLNGTPIPAKPEKPKPKTTTTKTTTVTNPSKGGSKSSFGFGGSTSLAPKAKMETAGVTSSGTCPDCKKPRRIKDGITWCYTKGCQKDGRKYTYSTQWLCVTCQAGATHWVKNGWKCSNPDCTEYAPETQYAASTPSKGIDANDKTVEVQTVTLPATPDRVASVEEPEGEQYTDDDDAMWMALWGSYYGL